MNITLNKKLNHHQKNNLYRHRRIRKHAETQVNFSSNDYLSLSKHPELIQSFQTAAKKYGVGSGASQLITGHYDAHHDCEFAFAEFLKRDRALLFGNGYMANLGVIDALTDTGDVIFQDRYNHASLLDGGRFSKANSQRYFHCNMEDLDKRLKKSSAKNHLLISDAVFSTDGNITPITTLSKIAKKYRASLMIDDAHGIGVLGKNGGGTLETCKLSQEDSPVLVCPLGKAFASYGAIVSGSTSLIETLIQFSRSYIYTTALPPALAAANLTSLALIQKESWRREKLQSLIIFFKEKAAERGIVLRPSNTPIQAIKIGDPIKAIQISEQLYQKGFLVSALRPPTVAMGESILRVTLNTSHNEQDIVRCLDAFILSSQFKNTPHPNPLPQGERGLAVPERKMRSHKTQSPLSLQEGTGRARAKNEISRNTVPSPLAGRDWPCQGEK